MTRAHRTTKACKKLRKAPHPGGRRKAMPPRISEEHYEAVAKMLKAMTQPNASAVKRALQSLGIEIGLGQIIRVADSEKIKLKPGLRKGQKLPADAKRGRGGGRPPVGAGQGKKYSLKRDKVIELRAKGLSLRAIAAEVGLSVEGVRGLLPKASPEQEISQPSTDGCKK